MRYPVLAALLLVGCGAPPVSPAVEKGLSDRAPLRPTRTACTASAYDGQAWTELGKFEAPPAPVVVGGEPMRNAQLEVGDLTFSADGNPDEGLVDFMVISDAASGSVAEVQLARAPILKLTLHVGGKLYNLSCAMSTP
jgi:hypothetical protein